jgi:hypothetical protein
MKDELEEGEAKESRRMTIGQGDVLPLPVLQVLCHR